jgi:hypothetical protein
VKDLLHFAYVERCRKVEENLVKAAAEARQLPRLELIPNFICPCFWWSHSQSEPDPLMTDKDILAERKT